MPSIVDNLKVVIVESSAIVHIGDSIILSPRSDAMSYSGAGSFNTGNFPFTKNMFSETKTDDPDRIDSRDTVGGEPL